MGRSTSKWMAGLCLLIALLAGAASGAGVFMRGDGSFVDVVSELGEKFPMATSGVYRNNAQQVVAEGVGWDIFTLFAVVPAMLIVVPLVARGSLRGRLFALGLLGYFAYQYLEYSVTWAFGPLFLLFVAIYGASLVGIVWMVWSLRLDEVVEQISPRFPARGMATFSIAMGSMLLLMWIARISGMLTGPQPAPLQGQTTLVVQALDLGLMVPLSLWTGIAAWRRSPVGHLLGVFQAVMGAAMAAAICGMLLSAWLVEGTLAAPPLVLFGAASIAAAWMSFQMLRGGAKAGPQSAPHVSVG